MKEFSWGIIVFGSGIVLLGLFICGAALFLDLPSSSIMERLINAAGLYITSIALILTTFLAILAVSTSSFVSRLRQMSNEVREIADKTRKEAKQAAKDREDALKIHEEIKASAVQNREDSLKILNEIKVAAIKTIDVYTKMATLNVWSSVATIKDLPSSPTFTDEQRKKVCRRLGKATEELTYTRATLILRMSYDPDDILSQLTVIAAMKRVKDIGLIQEVRSKWATNDQIRSLCDEVERTLREKGN